MTQSITINKSSSRKQQKADTRARILDIACTLCRYDGFLALKTLDVARLAGLAHGSIFVHFPTREELLVAVVERETAAMLQSVHERLEAGAGVTAILKQHLAGLSGHEDLYTWLVREAPHLPTPVADALSGVHSTLSWHLIQALERERSNGSVRPVPDAFVFNCWIGLVHHYLLNKDRFAPGASVLTARGQDMVANFMKLLKT